jgi:hypothetical protein
MMIKKFSGAGLYVVGLLAMEKQAVEIEIEELYKVVAERRDNEASDVVAMHERLKTLGKQLADLMVQLDTLGQLPI